MAAEVRRQPVTQSEVRLADNPPAPFSWKGWVASQFSQLHNTLNRIHADIREENRRMTKLEQAIDLLQKQVAANTTVIGSASALIAGLSKQLADAIAAAKDAGATDAQLAQLAQLQAAMKQSDDDLAAAVLAGTGGDPVPEALAP
jgi:chromosome segregation ATPase